MVLQIQASSKNHIPPPLMTDISPCPTSENSSSIRSCCLSSCRGIVESILPPLPPPTDRGLWRRPPGERMIEKATANSRCDSHAINRVLGLTYIEHESAFKRESTTPKIQYKHSLVYETTVQGNLPPDPNAAAFLATCKYSARRAWE